MAAIAGALDLERAHKVAPKIAIAHACLMGAGLTLIILSLIGRVASDYNALTPPAWWVIAASGTAFVLMIGGAWFGGELVYGRGVGVRLKD